MSSMMMPNYRPNQPAMNIPNTTNVPNMTNQVFPSTSGGSTLPTGLPLGPAPLGVPAVPGVNPELPPQSVSSSYFTAGYLRTQIGRRMRVEFLIGTNGALVDRTGTLVGVGASYILLRPDGTDITVMADIYSIKFVTIYAAGSNQPIV